MEEVAAEISSSASRQILIQAQHAHSGQYYAVGAIRNFNVVQSRDIQSREQYDENGKVQVELIPGRTHITITLDRTVFDTLSLAQALGQLSVSIANQTHPFNIQYIENWSEHGHSYELTTTYNNCWFTSLTTPIKADSYVIIESGTVVCEYISSVRTQKMI